MDFKAMLEYVDNMLKENNAIRPRNPLHQFRNRYSHSYRVYEWCKRLKDDIPNMNLDALYTAAIFHDVGYSYGKASHDVSSAAIFKEYAINHGFDNDFIDYVYNIIIRHSDKSLLREHVEPELIILLEADLLDEEGATGICWDLMAEGQTKPDDYASALNAVWTHSSHILNQNYMVTPLAAEYWARKKELVKIFIKELEADLFLGE